MSNEATITVREAARRLSVTRQRVFQLMKLAGVTATPSGYGTIVVIQERELELLNAARGKRADAHV